MSYNPSDAFQDAISVPWSNLDEAIREHLIQAGVDHKQILRFIGDIEAVVLEIEEYLDETKVEDFPSIGRNRFGGLFTI